MASYKSLESIRNESATTENQTYEAKSSSNNKKFLPVHRFVNIVIEICQLTGQMRVDIVK